MNVRKSKLCMLCLLLVLSAVLLCSLPTKAAAATKASGICGENLTWSLDDQGTLTISGTGAMYSYQYNTAWDTPPQPWYPYSGSVKNVVIEEGVTSIGEYAFACCYDLDSITIAASVTRIYSSFAMNSGVTSIYFEGALPTLSFGVHCDENCTDWTCDGGTCGSFCGISATMYYPSGDASYDGAEDMQFCLALTWLAGADRNILWVENEGGTVTITGLDDKTVTELVIPEQIDGKNVTHIAPGAFSGCTGLTKVYYSGTLEQWNAITIGADNTCLTGATLHTGGTCGELEVFEIAVSRMILGNALEFQFGVEKNLQSDWTGAYAVIEKQWADGTVTTKTIPVDLWGSADQYWAIAYDGLAAKEMGDIIKVTVYNADGVAISKPKTDSARDYMARAFDSQSETGKTMLVDMLNYGAAAQQKFGYDTKNLANSGLTDAQKAYATQEAPLMGNYQYKGPHYLGSRFILESRIQMQVAFGGLTDDMYAVYNYTDACGKTRSVRVEGKNFITAGSRKGIELNQLVYADARGQVTIMVYNADGSLYGMAIDSIESCANRSTTGNDVFVALMKFADSARKHLYG